MEVNSWTWAVCTLGSAGAGEMLVSAVIPQVPAPLFIAY